MSARVIPTLLIDKGRHLVKTVRFAKPTYIGDPINAVQIFNKKEVDELIVVDIDASRQGRGPDFAMAEDLASECFMPLCYGGGIRSVDDAERLFAAGIEKVAVQTGALRDMGLLRQLADRFGSQSVVFSIDVKQDWRGRTMVFSAAGAKVSAPWTDVIGQAVAAGAGEIMLTSVDREGSMKGMDLALIRQASAVSQLPLIAAGGVGSLDHIGAAVAAGADAVAAGSFFVFRGAQRGVLITYPTPSELSGLFAAV